MAPSVEASMRLSLVALFACAAVTVLAQSVSTGSYTTVAEPSSISMLIVGILAVVLASRFTRRH